MGDMKQSRWVVIGVAALTGLLLGGCSVGGSQGPGAAVPSPPTASAASPSVTGTVATSPGSQPAPAATQPDQTTTQATSVVPTDWRTIAIDPAAPSNVPLSAAQARVALSVLATIPTKGRAPRTGYSRAQFSTSPGNPDADVWTDNSDAGLDAPFGHNGCDTRNDVLGRDLAGISFKAGTHCKVLTGVLDDPYTASTIDFVCGPKAMTTGACEASASYADRVQIDHDDSLSDAWQTGAQSWDTVKRVAFANDPLNLLAVDGPTNEAKGDGDAATWLPANKSFRPSYVARQVAVKAKYGLWMTQAEHDAIAGILQGV